MLESPTGTGKTLCLLAASLAWREHHLNQLEQAQLALAEQTDLFIEGELTVESLAKAGIEKPRAPVIIYASRTHSQLSQVVSELHRTAYADNLNVCVLGSRAQMCIHPIVSQVKGGMGAVNRACATHVQRSTCSYHTNAELYITNVPRTKDIEDLIMWGRRNSTCPYYVAKDQQAIADIVFMPYNYIIDPLIRRSLTVDLRDSIIIIDEAHNLESVASDSASFDLSSLELKQCLSQIQQCIDLVGSPQLPAIPAGGIAASNTTGSESSAPYADSSAQAVPSHITMDADDDWIVGSADAQVLKTVIEALLKEIAATQFPASLDVKVSDGKWLFDFFAKVGITLETAPGYLRTVERVTAILTDPNSDLVQPQGMAHVPPSMNNSSFAAVNALSSFGEALRKMFMTGVPIAESSQHFKAVLQRDSSGSNGGDKRARSAFVSEKSYKLSFWCFYPGLAMQSLVANSGLRSLIVTSGTLSPLDSFAYELGVPFPIRLENPHVIPASQIWVGVFSSAVDGEKLNSRHDQRSGQYTRSLGFTLSNIARITPGGMLVFFPSYNMMETCLAEWQHTSPTIWEQICRYKQPVVEPKESNKLKQAMLDYYHKVDQPPAGTLNGAAFFAVCRGKVSEGLDFSNNYGRSVVITGLPFAMTLDQKVKLKKEYLDNQAMQRTAAIRAQAKNNPGALPPKPLTGSEWYSQSAWRAVNQAIGRVIRHRNDYGAIILADERFLSAQTQPLSRWLRPYVRPVNDIGVGFQEMTKFFQINAEKLPVQPKNSPSTSATSSANQVIAQANSRRTSVFSALDSAPKHSAHTSATTSATTLTAPSPAPKPASDKKESGDRVKNILILAKAQLDATTYQLFQSKLRSYKANKSIPRHELYSALADMLKNYPEVLAALADTLGRTRATPTRSSATTPSAAHSPGPTLQELFPINLLPHVLQPADRSLTTSPTKPLSPASSPQQITPIPSPALPVVPPVPDEPPSIEIINTVPSKKRANDHGIDQEVAPPPKRPFVTSPWMRPAQPMPSDSILDTSLSQGSAEPSKHREEPTEPASVESISSTSSSLQFVGVSAAPPAPVREEPLPQLRRGGSSTADPKPSSWIQGLTRGGSGGIASNLSVDIPALPPISPSATPGTTPKKPYVDLITGNMVSSARMPTIWAANAAPSADESVLISDSLPLSSPQVECPICAKTTSDFRTAPCGHSCCFECWQGWLTQKMECPFCRGRVRPKKLQKPSKK